MRVDRASTLTGIVDWASPKTWLLAAVALWALCFWGLGVLGLGERIRVLPDDPSLLQRLPQPTKPPPERLRLLGNYSEIGARPLFSDDRQPQPFFINPEGQGKETQAFDYILTSVMRTPKFSMAIVQPTEGGDSIRIKMGDAPSSAPSWTLISVDPRSAVFSGPEGEKTLELRVFDGTGGEPPTAIATGPREPNSPPMNMEPGEFVPEPGMPPVRRVMPPSMPQTAGRTPVDPDDAEDSAPVRTSEEQIAAIRKRIEARRAQLQKRLQESSVNAPDQIE